MFRADMLIIRRSNLYYTISGVIKPIGGHPVHRTATYRCDDTRDCIIQIWPPDDEHICSKHIEAWNKLIVKQKFCVSRWLITEINNILCLWFRASLIYINNCPTRYNTKQLIYYSASSQAAQKTWLVPEAAVTVLCTPYDGCGWHQKHVEWTCRIINRLLCVASRWAIINTNTISCECKWMALN